jgi:hypothetical protein
VEKNAAFNVKAGGTNIPPCFKWLDLFCPSVSMEEFEERRGGLPKNFVLGCSSNISVKIGQK